LLKKGESPVEIALKDDRIDILQILIGRYGAHVPKGSLTKSIRRFHLSTTSYLVGISLGGEYPESMLVTSELVRLGIPYSNQDDVKQSIRKGLEDRKILRRQLMSTLPKIFRHIPVAIVHKIALYVCYRALTRFDVQLCNLKRGENIKGSRNYSYTGDAVA
jgi:hypothetical protein